MTLTFSSFGQNDIKTGKTNKRAIQPNKLVGTWRLIEFADCDSLTGNIVMAKIRKNILHIPVTQTVADAARQSCDATPGLKIIFYNTRFFEIIFKS